MIFRGFRNGVKLSSFYVECDFGAAANQVVPGNLVPGPYPIDTTGASLGNSLVFDGTKFGPGTGGGSGANPDPVKVVAASTATVANLQSVSTAFGGTTIAQGDLVLLKDTASPDGIVGASHAYDGYYVMGTVVAGFGPLTRAPGYTTAASVTAGAGAYVQSGTNLSKLYRQLNLIATINTTAQSWYPLEERTHEVDFETGTAQFNFVFGGPASFSGPSNFIVQTAAMTVQTTGSIAMETGGGGSVIFLDGGDNLDSIRIGTQTAIAGIIMGTASVPVDFVGGLTVHAGKAIVGAGILSIDATAASLSIGVGSATTITIGRTAIAVSFPGGLTVGSGKAILGSGALDVDATGLLQLGVNGATTSMNVGHSGAVQNFPGGILIADTKALTGGGDLIVDAGSAHSLSIGPTNANAIAVGSASVAPSFPGGLTIANGKLITSSGGYTIDAAAGLVIGGSATSITFTSTSVVPIFNAGLQINTAKTISTKTGDLILFPAFGGGMMIKLGSGGGSQSLYLDSSGRMSIGSSNPDANSILDLQSTTRAFLPPRMDTTARDLIPSPTEGMQIWNTTTHVPNFYNGTSWKAVALV